MDVFVLCYEDTYEGGPPTAAFPSLDAAQEATRPGLAWTAFEDFYWSARIGPKQFARIYKVSLDISSQRPVG